jgi:type II secretory pathway component GspD/PulD (secretin)
MRLHRHASLTFCGLLVFAFSGCATRQALEPQGSVAASPALARAEDLFLAGRYSDAIVATAEVARKDPLTPGLPELQARIMRTLSEARQRSNINREANTDARMADDVLARNVVPDTYQLKRNVRGETTPLRSAPSKMQEALAKDVTVHLENVDLAAFAAQIASTEGINIVADGNLGGSTMTIHAEGTPLIEILEYVGRNLGVTFSVGNNLIWATQSQDEQGALPLQTRIYRLRKGLAGDELARPQSGSQGGGGQGGRGGRGGGGGFGGIVPPNAGGGGNAAAAGPSVIDIIGRFITQPDGADILFNEKAHILVVKNTRENLALTEDIIAAMDLTPPQVLIEARFVSASIDNLSELGVDWILDSPYAISTVEGRGNKTQIPAGATIGYAGFPNTIQGMNFTYQGVLTDPQFRAIVHILETSGKARTLSVPRVTTINNRPATIRVGEDFRYYEEYDLEEYDTVQGTGDNATTVTRTQLVPVGTPTLEELGIQLSATPSVGADLTSINLALIPEISEFVRWEYYEASNSGNNRSSGSSDSTNNNDPNQDLVSGGTGMLKLPVFRRSRIETDVVVRSGETIIMGGLITSTRSKQRSGVPILSSLPFVGQLFRHDTVEELRQNLIIFVTATLISEVGEELIPLEDIRAGVNELHEGVGASPAPGAEKPSAEPAAVVPPAAVLLPAVEDVAEPAPVAVEVPEAPAAAAPAEGIAQ